VGTQGYHNNRWYRNHPEVARPPRPSLPVAEKKWIVFIRQVGAAAFVERLLGWRFAQIGIPFISVGIAFFLASRNHNFAGQVCFTVAGFWAIACLWKAKPDRATFSTGTLVVVGLLLWIVPIMGPEKGEVAFRNAAPPSQSIEAKVDNIPEIQAPATVPARTDTPVPALHKKPRLKQPSTPGLGIRNMIVADVHSSGDQFTIYNGGSTDHVDYKEICNGSGGTAIANMGPVTNARYENITSGNGCPPAPTR
jgi:hypothetical protein